MRTLTLWKDVWALHCPHCDNIWDIEWLDGEDKLGNGQYRCPECLSVFVPTAKMFKTSKHKHGTFRDGNSYYATESLNTKARREARE